MLVSMTGGQKASILQSYTSLDKPCLFVEGFSKKHPLATEQLIASEDKAFFMMITQHPGQKPVPFIPILDSTFEVCFKKVSFTQLFSFFLLWVWPFGSRILSGLQGTSMRFSTRTPSMCASCRVLSL